MEKWLQIERNFESDQNFDYLYCKVILEKEKDDQYYGGEYLNNIEPEIAAINTKIDHTIISAFWVHYEKPTKPTG